ncbi:MAG: hypothetical protein AAF703_23750 [Cyanobacteria bacterium P01_D01_bin.105]
MIEAGFYEYLLKAARWVVVSSIISTVFVTVVATILIVFWQRKRRVKRVKTLTFKALKGAVLGSVLVSAGWSALILILGFGLNQLAYRGGQGFIYAMLPIIPLPLPPLPTIGAAIGSIVSMSRSDHLR